jgi:hypothetical protein
MLACRDHVRADRRAEMSIVREPARCDNAPSSTTVNTNTQVR